MALSNLNFELEDKYDPAEFLNKTIIPEIEKETHKYVTAELFDFSGEVITYSPGLGDTVSAFPSLSGRNKISQDAKAALGPNEETTKYELCLKSELLSDYKYGVMIIEYGATGYPVIVVIAEDIANQIEGGKRVYKCSTMEDFGSLCNLVLETDTLREVVQGIIQAAIRKEKRDK